MDRHIFPAWRLNSCFIKFLFILMSAFATFSSGNVWAVQQSVDAGFSHTILLKSDGNMYAWGGNGNGQFGDGTTTNSSTPRLVMGPTSGFTAVSASYGDTVGLKGSSMWAWGYNTVGQLGDGTTTHRSAPVQVSGMSSGVTAISPGWSFTLELQNGTVYGSGKNLEGQLGNPNGGYSYYPIQVTDLTGVNTISAGTYHGLALKTNGEVWVWGDNTYGRLGTGRPDNEFSPVKLNGFTNVSALSSNTYNSLALKSDGTVWAWGRNDYGQLGDGTYTQRTSPTQVSGLTGVIAISAGEYHNIALKSNGTVWAWGRNNYGQLGDGTTTTRNTPVQVTGLSNVVAISAGFYHNVALTSYGHVWTWGLDDLSQLGGGYTTKGLLGIGNIPDAFKSTATQVEIQIDITVTATAGAGGTISPSSQTVPYGNTATFNVTPNTGYSISAVSGCGGTLNGNTFTTGAITQPCSVSASFTLNTYTVSATAGTGGTVSPSSLVVNHGSRAAFTVTPNSGYVNSSTVGGTCPAGTWNGTTYTTGVVTGTCSVSFSFLPLYTVTATAGSNGSISPSSQIVPQGSTAEFMVTPSSGYSILSVTGCNGSLVGSTYTTGPVMSACNVNAQFAAPPSVTTGAVGGINASGGATLNGTVNPNGASTTVYFEYGTTTSYGNSINVGGGFSGNSTQAVAGALSGLTCNATYHYRTKGVNSMGTSHGADATFVACKSKTHADFNGDGMSDILWRHSTTGDNSMWFMNGVTRTSVGTVTAIADTTWIVGGIGDFDGNGKADILWRHLNTDGQVSVWLMDGATKVAGAPVDYITDLNWKVVGIGDFNGDGKSDILWRHLVTGQNVIWFMNGTTRTSYASVETIADTTWIVGGVGDFNGDGKADILWRHLNTDGQVSVWLMNGATKLSGAVVEYRTDLNWRVAGVGDFNADGKVDILWRHQTSGQNYLELMNGATKIWEGDISPVSDTNWKIVDVSDYNADGMADILWRHATTGSNTIWLMNGATGNGYAIPAVTDLNWKVQPIGQ